MLTLAKQTVAALLVLATMGALLTAQGDKTPASGLAMTQAAQKFLASLSPEQKAQATFKFDDAERLNWHFIPRPRKGLPLKDMTGAALQAAQDLAASGLTKAGYDQVLNIMSLEDVLYLIEEGTPQERREKRDPRKYYFSVFGTPSESGTWGWRLEGHHLSLNYTIENGVVASSTPEFYGTNPAVIEAGPGRSIRVLGPEEDLARQILKLCSGDQVKAAHLDPKAPDDIRGANIAQPDTSAPVGLPAEKMNDDQKKILAALLDEYLKNMPADVSRRRLEALKKAGFEKIYFAWWGGSERNERHYYRVQGPTFLIEYNNTQNNANHVHAVWRDMAGDFAIPLAK